MSDKRFRPIRADDPADDPPPPRRGLGAVWVVAAGLGGLLIGGIVIGGAVLIRDRRAADERKAVPPPVVEAKVEPKVEPKPVVEKPAGVNPAARPAIAWQPFADPDKRFNTAFPNGPPTKKAVLGAEALGKGSVRWERGEGGRTYSVSVLVIDPLFGDAGILDALVEQIGGGSAGTPLTLGGVKGTQSVAVLGTSVVWTAVLNKTTAVIVAIDGPSGLKADDPAVKPFFDAMKPAR